MHSNDGHLEQRRRVLALLGTGAVALPILGLVGCGGDDTAESSGAAEPMQKAAKETAPKAKTTSESAMAEAEKAMEPAKEAMNDAMDSAKSTAKEAMESAESTAKEAAKKTQTIATDAAASMTKVDEKSSQAQQLGYRHDASTVDKSKQPRYASGQQCSNCAIYQGGDANWGGCPLFAGKQVKATGWCNAYVKAS